MSFEVIIVLGVLVVALVLFVQERLPVDLIALGIAAFLMFTGILTPQEGLSGFSNPATVTITAMFVLSAGVSRTEAVERMGLQLRRLAERGYLFSLTVMMLCVGLLSAFVNNTATVALLIPVIISVCRDTKMSPSKLLMPLSFASLLGGMCTLIGTSTNILVSTLAKDAGMKEFGMFELAPVGLALYLVGAVYLIIFGHRLLPSEPPDEDLTEMYDMAEYVTDLVVEAASGSVGKSSDNSPLHQALDIDILRLVRDGQAYQNLDQVGALRPNDILRVRCDIRKLKKIEEQEGVTLLPKRKWSDLNLSDEETTLVETVIAPNSSLVGRTLEEVDVFPRRYEALVLALRQHGEMEHEGLLTTPISAGAALLLRVRKNQVAKLKTDPDFVVISELETPRPTKTGTFKALFILLTVILLAATGVIPIVVSALAGCVAMCLWNVLSVEEAYQAIEWKVVFMLGSVLPLGIAMEKSGAAELIAQNLLAVVGQFGPHVVLAALYLLTSVATAMMSNTTTAALLVPIAITTAHSLGVDPRPFLIAITFGASTAFMTPMGYQTNLMIYSAGRYRFDHFLKVGTPLNILCWMTASLLIPYVWSF